MSIQQTALQNIRRAPRHRLSTFERQALPLLAELVSLLRSDAKLSGGAIPPSHSAPGVAHLTNNCAACCRAPAEARA